MIEAQCYVVDDYRIELEHMLKYVADPINETTECRMFRPCRPLSLSTKQFCTQLTKAYVTETSCNQLLLSESATKVSIQHQFASY